MMVEKIGQNDGTVNIGLLERNRSQVSNVDGEGGDERASNILIFLTAQLLGTHLSNFAQTAGYDVCGESQFACVFAINVLYHHVNVFQVSQVHGHLEHLADGPVGELEPEDIVDGCFSDD